MKVRPGRLGSGFRGAILLGTVLLASCERPAPPPPAPGLLAPTRAPAPGAGKLVILGMDGLEWTLLRRMVEAGELPHFQALLREGATAEVAIPQPIMSPILWTTIASGYPGEVHGVGGWTNGRGRPYTGADVRVERLWDALAARGEASVVSGWLMSWPATPIPGAMLTERFVWSFPMNKDPDEPVLEGRETWATTAPDSLAARAEALRPDEAWLAASPLAYQIAAYGAPYHPFPRDETHVRVFEDLWPEAGARLGAVYLNAADQVSHLYWPFTDPLVQDAIRADPEARRKALAARPPADQRPLPYDGPLDAVALAEASRWVPDVYRALDDALGRVRAKLDADTTLVVCSDHGFRTSSAQPLLNGGHREVAVLIAAGRAVRKGAHAQIDVLDLAPSFYALLGLPAAEDMPGRARTELFDVTPLPPVPTRKLSRVAVEALGPSDDLADRQLREQLEALGYIDAEGKPLVEIGASRREGGR